MTVLHEQDKARQFESIVAAEFDRLPDNIKPLVVANLVLLILSLMLDDKAVATTVHDVLAPGVMAFLERCDAKIERVIRNPSGKPS